MKHATPLTTLALILAAGSFVLVGGCGKSEQSASTGQTGSEVATIENQQPATTEQAPATAEQAAASGESAESTGQAPAAVASETE